jgi:Serendipity locus alpha protein (SRY-A)
VKSANDDVHTGIAEPENFITLLDDILDALSPFVALDSDSHDVNNKAAQRAELMMESSEIRGSIEQLLSHAMAFANIAVESDKNPLTALSQNLLKIAIDFEEEFSLAQPGKKTNSSSQRMKALELESSICSLENYVNDALLRLVFEVFHIMDGNVIEDLKNLKDSTELEQEVNKFDLLVDRLIQIGHFAIWFSRDDQKISSIVRSCVASIESLDSYLIPAITSGSDPSLDVFQAHFEEEARSLQNHVQQIIDTKAFCSSLMEQLNVGIEANKVNFDKKSLMNLVQRSNVLLNHFQINAKTLDISSDKVAKFYFSDFKLILTECEAILNFPEAIEDFEPRAIKRFKILYFTIRKLQNAIKNLQKSSFDDEVKNSKHENFVKVSEFPSKCSDYFNTIRPSALGSILYESKRSIKIPSKSQNTSKLTTTLRRSSKKRKSLRIAIFKKQHDFENEEAWNNDEKFNETMDLQITEILDRLTDLSTTLTQKSNAN